MRRFLKRSAELAVVRSGLSGVWRRVSGTDAIVLAYHNIVPDGDPPVGDTSLHLPLSRFSEQVDHLSETHTIVSLQHLLKAGPGGGKPLAAITFDDAYRGAVELGVDLLIRNGIPLTVFVSPGLLGCEGFWWDQVADPGLRGVDPGFRQMALQDLGGRQEAILHRAHSLGVLGASLPALYRPAAEKQVEALAQHPLVTLGSHTWSHVHLASVSRETVKEELQRSLAWLRKLATGRPSLLSYPYGGFQKDTEFLARHIGYEAGFLIQGGAVKLHHALTDPFAIPRLNVPREISTEGFQARVSGVWPQ